MTDQVNPDPDWITLCEAVTLLATGKATTAKEYRRCFVEPSSDALQRYHAWHRRAGACEVASWYGRDVRKVASRRLAPLATVASWREVVIAEDERWSRVEAAGRRFVEAWRRKQINPRGRHEDGGGHQPLPRPDIATPYECDPVKNAIVPEVKAEPGPDKRRELLYWEDIRVLKSEIEALRQPPKAAPAATPTESPPKPNGTPGPRKYQYPKVRKYIDYEIGRDIGDDGPRKPDRERGRLFLESAKWADVFERVGKYLDNNFKNGRSTDDWPDGRTRRIEILKDDLRRHGIDR